MIIKTFNVYDDTRHKIGVRLHIVLEAGGSPNFQDRVECTPEQIAQLQPFMDCANGFPIIGLSISVNGDSYLERDYASATNPGS